MCQQLYSRSVPSVWLSQRNWSSENMVGRHFKNSTKGVRYVGGGGLRRKGKPWSGCKTKNKQVQQKRSQIWKILLDVYWLMFYCEYAGMGWEHKVCQAQSLKSLGPAWTQGELLQPGLFKGLKTTTEVCSLSTPPSPKAYYHARPFQI